MNLQPIEDALRVWVKTATGLPDGQIYFANQNGPQPGADGIVRPFITILLGVNGTTLGLPEIERTTDLTQPPGQEVTQTPVNFWDLDVQFQAFAENTVSYPIPTFPLNPPAGSGITAMELLMRVQDALGLESVHGALNAANIAPYEYGTIHRLDALVETLFEGRALLEMKCYVSDFSQQEQVGYFKEVQAIGTLSGGGNPDPRTVSLDVVGS